MNHPFPLTRVAQICTGFALVSFVQIANANDAEIVIVIIIIIIGEEIIVEHCFADYSTKFPSVFQFGWTFGFLVHFK